MSDDPIVPTADLCDRHDDRARVLSPALRNFGGRVRFCGTVATVRVDNDNGLIRAMLGERGDGRVLVIDNGGSDTAATIGDNLGQLAVTSGWSGIVVWGAVRDTAALSQLPLGVRALTPFPRRGGRDGGGQRDVTITIGGIAISSGDWLTADEDGIVVSDRALR